MTESWQIQPAIEFYNNCIQWRLHTVVQVEDQEYLFLGAAIHTEITQDDKIPTLYLAPLNSPPNKFQLMMISMRPTDELKLRRVKLEDLDSYHSI